MRRSRLAELRRARPIAWQNALQREAIEPCWRTSAAGHAWQQHLTRILSGDLPEAPLND